MEEEIRLRDLSIFQDFIQMGKEEGREEEAEKAHQEAEKAREEAAAKLRHLLLIQVRTRFPTLLTRARVQANRMKTPEILGDVLGKLIQATTTEEAQQVLREWRTTQKKPKAE